MFICNFKINQKKVVKIFIIIASIIVLGLLAFIISQIWNNIQNISSENTLVSDEIPSPDVAKITSENYTNILKEVHENLDTYIGQKISFMGYIYRVDDLKENQFILARDMIINSKNQTVVVGFLCEYENASEFENNTWVDLTGEITKGYYYGDIPVLKITSIEKCNEPEDPYVEVPSDSYVPTAVIY